MIAVLICGAALVVFGFLGRFFARMIQASISRKREFLADASAVQFTRNPDGIAGALKLIAATSAGSAIASGEADEVSHMFFANCFQSGVTKLFATHPPLPVRINKLQPDFDGDLNKWIEARKQKSQQKAAKKDTSSAAKMASSVLPLGRLFPQAIVDRFPIDPIVLLAAIGSPQDKDMQRTRALLKQVPVEILDSVRDPFSARCLAFAMLISDDPNDREQQLQLLGEIENPATLKATDALLDPVSNLHLIFRLPVMELLQASLADLSPPQYLQFRNTVQRLVHADQRTSLFEFVIRHHLLLHLDRRFTQRNRPKVKYTRASELQREIELMLSAFASASVMGSVLDSQPEPDKAVILQAYHLAMEVVGFGSVVDSHAELRLWEVEQLEGCMQKLHHASPKLKKQFLHAAAVLITFDHEITVAEAEFFRAVAESLDCPVPLLAAGRTTAANAPTQPTGEAEAS